MMMMVYVRTGGKVLKTLQCLHDEGFVVVKIYIKRDKVPTRATTTRSFVLIRVCACRFRCCCCV